MQYIRNKVARLESVGLENKRKAEEVRSPVVNTTWVLEPGLPLEAKGGRRLHQC